MEGEGVLTETAGRSAVERELVGEDRDDYARGERGEGGGGCVLSGRKHTGAGRLGW